MSNQTQKMANVDTAWWHMEEPQNLMMITTIMICDGPVDRDRLREAIAARLLRYDRFRQRVVDPGPLRNTRWEMDPHFDLDAHLHWLRLPSPGDQIALEALVGDLMSTPLDYTKPLWQTHVVEGVGDGHAVIFRLHHCLADGIALMQVLLSMTDDTPDAPQPLLPSPPPRPSRSLLGTLTSPVRGAARLVERTAKTAVNLSQTAVQTGLEILNDPALPEVAARDGWEFGKRLVKVTLRAPDPPNPFRGELGTVKRAAWSGGASLADAKAAAKIYGGSINDLLVTAFSGALRRYAADQGVDTTGMAFRAYIPVNMRRPDEVGTLGNKFGLVYLTLPVGTVNRQERFNLVKARMDELKGSPEAQVAFVLLNVAGMLPKEAEQLAFSWYHAKATAVFTNVPGPQHQLYLAGSPMQSIMGWVPQAGGLALGISILSYNGQIALGLNTDAGLIPDPRTIIGYYEEEIAALFSVI